MITAMTSRRPPTEQLRLQERQRRQHGFLQLMETRGNPREFQAHLQTWLDNYRRSSDAFSLARQ